MRAPRTATVALAGLTAVFLIAGAPASRAETVLEFKNGRKMVGEAVKSETDDALELVIYRSFVQKVPKSAVLKRTDIDRSQREERAALAERLAGLKPEDIPGRTAAADWARDKGLVVQSLAILQELRARFPADQSVARAIPAQPARRELSAEDRDFLQRQMEAFFAKPEGRAQILADLKGRDALPPEAAADWARRCFEEARKGLKVQAGDTKFKTAEFEGDLHIELWRKPQPAPPPVPASGTVTTPAAPAAQAPPAAPAGLDEAPWPVLIALHGGGKDDGNWKSGGPELFKSFRKDFDRMILVAPTVLHKEYAEWGGNPQEEQYVREIFNAVKRTWKIDTDRVYLAGTSMGGYGTWHIGGHQADRFAGLFSGAGGILIANGRGESWAWGIVGNLMHTPIAFVHGGKDQQAPPWSDAESDKLLTALAAERAGCYRHNYQFFPDVGHNVPGDALEKAVRWVTQSKRNPCPDRIVWEPKRSFDDTFYWLKVEKPQVFSRIEAQATDNRVKLTTLNLNGGFSVFLNQQLVDLGKPVTVEVNGQVVFDGPVQPRLSAILESLADRIDERQCFPAKVDF